MNAPVLWEVSKNRWGFLAGAPKCFSLQLSFRSPIQYRNVVHCVVQYNAIWHTVLSITTQQISITGLSPSCFDAIWNVSGILGYRVLGCWVLWYHLWHRGTRYWSIRFWVTGVLDDRVYPEYLGTGYWDAGYCGTIICGTGVPDTEVLGSGVLGY